MRVSEFTAWFSALIKALTYTPLLRISTVNDVFPLIESANDSPKIENYFNNWSVHKQNWQIPISKLRYSISWNTLSFSLLLASNSERAQESQDRIRNYLFSLWWTFVSTIFCGVRIIQRSIFVYPPPQHGVKHFATRESTYRQSINGSCLPIEHVIHKTKTNRTSFVCAFITVATTILFILYACICIGVCIHTVYLSMCQCTTRIEHWNEYRIEIDRKSHHEMSLLKRFPIPLKVCHKKCCEVNRIKYEWLLAFVTQAEFGAA